MIDYPLIDTHVHLCDPSLFSYSWEEDAPSLKRSVLPSDVTKAAAPLEIERFVFVEVDVEPSLRLDETAWVAGLARTDSRIGAIVASLPLENGAAVAADLERLQEHDLLRGIRRLIQAESDPEFCTRPEFIAGIKLLTERDLHFEICILHHQMPAVLEMVRQCPNTRFILDHIGKPGIKAGAADPWRGHMRELAAMDNVWCKISGAITEADHADWTPADVRPYVAHAIDCFGFDRCMFGSDFHVLTLAGTYPGWVEIVDDVVADASDDERRKLFRDNAIGFYRLQT